MIRWLLADVRHAALAAGIFAFLALLFAAPEGIGGKAVEVSPPADPAPRVLARPAAAQGPFVAEEVEDPVFEVNPRGRPGPDATAEEAQMSGAPGQARVSSPTGPDFPAGLAPPRGRG